MFSKLSQVSKIFLLSLILLIFTACATYYVKSSEFQNHISQGNFEKAEKWLEKDTYGQKSRNILLHQLNRGYVSWMLNDYDESNKHFGEAEILIEDYINNNYLNALTLVSNPSIKPYKPEDFEAVLVNYFMALNYIKLHKFNDAIVECKRINIKLQKLNDKYKDYKNKYQRDAFAHTLMGIIYEADKDYNNAFIAYRNALEVYETDYKDFFNMSIPTQLKYDILRTAKLIGFNKELKFYENKFNIKYKYIPKENGEVIFFWLNGFGPVKGENSINFTKIPNSKSGYITLVNEENNLSFPLYIGNKSSKEKNAFNKLRFFRVAFPKYVERKPFYTKAKIISNNKSYKLELVEDINSIAFKSLKDRMAREMGSAILRLATKKALEAIADNQDARLGTLINIVNTVTEKADTRNWQTLPYSISYARIPLKTGTNNLRLETYSPTGSTEQTFSFAGKKGKTYFQTFHSTATKY